MGHATLEQSMDYVHRGEAARQRILAALGDEKTKRLRVVGHDLPRGTDPRPSGSDDDRSDLDTKGGLTCTYRNLCPTRSHHVLTGESAGYEVRVTLGR
jgi:hypothetical protein